MKKFLKIAVLALTVSGGVVSLNAAAHAGTGFYFSNGSGGGIYLDGNGGTSFYSSNGSGGHTCLGARC
jgi:hypothetical protein